MNNLRQLDKKNGRTVSGVSVEFGQFVYPELYVGRLHLTDFRSYDQVTVEPSARSVVLCGPNGAGKTNILEALSFLSPGRGLRRCRLGDVSRRGKSGTETESNCRRNWAVAARLESPHGTMTLGTGLVAGSETEAMTCRNGEGGQKDKRVVRIDGQNGSSPALFGDILQVAWLTPQMDRLFIESPSGRRRFLDRIVANFHSSHRREINAYERLMRERNRLLQEGNRDSGWLAALEGRMAEHGVAVAAARLDAMDRLAGAIEESTSCFPRASLEVEGVLEQGLARGPALMVEDDFRRLLRHNRPLDSRSGRTTAGPHKTDLLVTHRDRAMPAALCSTGEQKALLIAITLASARIMASSFGAAPILLLDEVVAHLDRIRRLSLFDEIAALGSQVWLTGTDRLLFEGFSGQACYFRVENNIITPT